MKATVTNPESWKRVFEIVVPNEDVQKAFDERILKVQKEIKLPGFRPGKVPTPLIKQRFSDAIRAETIDELIKKSFQDACEQNNINPVSVGMISNIQAEAGQDLKFQIEAEVDPEIDLSGYDQLGIKPEIQKVDDAQVDSAIKDLLERFASFDEVSGRGAQQGDFIQFEYLKVIIDGEERSDIKNPNYPVELGNENRIKDFDKGIIGHVTGDEFDISVQFPSDYQDPEVAGRAGDFKIKLTKVLEKKIPELNEEFLKKLEMESVDALRDRLRTNLQAEVDERVKNEAYNKAIDAIIASNPFDVPPSRIDQFMDYMVQEYTQHKRPNEQVPTKEELKEKYTELAIKTIKRQRIISFVAKKEKIKATQDEVDKQIQAIANQYNQPFEEVKQRMRQSGMTNRIRNDIAEHKTLDFLIGEYKKESESGSDKE